MDMFDRRHGEDRRMQGRRQSDTSGYDAHGQQAASQKHEELVRKHLKLVNFIVSRLAIGLPSWIDKRDLISAGVIGLIGAAKQFNPAKGVAFETYASTRIRGAVFDELRSMDWIPRSVREKSKLVERAIAELTGQLHRFPTDMEVASHLGWEMDRYHAVIEEISGTTLLSLDEIISVSQSGDTVARIDSVKGTNENPLGEMERKELLDRLVKVIASLSEQERLVIALYYYEELTLKEIGLVLKVTESRISQIHTTAILKIRARLHSAYA
jgi:RNA polymerase sigma factor FliA